MHITSQRSQLTGSETSFLKSISSCRVLPCLLQIRQCLCCECEHLTGQCFTRFIFTVPAKPGACQTLSIFHAMPGKTGRLHRPEKFPDIYSFKSWSHQKWKLSRWAKSLTTIFSSWNVLVTRLIGSHDARRTRISEIFLYRTIWR